MHKEILKKFETYDIKGLILYGSQVYGTTHKDSDYDYLLIVDKLEEGELEIIEGKNSFKVISSATFKKELDQHDIRALEVYNSPWILGEKKDFKFKLNLTQLRNSISTKASNSWVKAKKKILQNDLLLGQKSLFHSLRILKFGIQLANNGTINNYQEANEYFQNILKEDNYEILKEKYQPIYNNLKTEFKKLCPKE